jgi:hypothetical protein
MTITISRADLVAHLARCVKPIADCPTCASHYGLIPHEEEP